MVLFISNFLSHWVGHGLGFSHSSFSSLLRINPYIKKFGLANYCKRVNSCSICSSLCDVSLQRILLIFLQIKESKDRAMSMLSPYRTAGSHDIVQDQSLSSLQGAETCSIPFVSIMEFVSEIYQVCCVRGNTFN